jgi:MFS family permease
VTTARQIYDLTGSAVALGFFGLVSALPLIPTSLLGGVLADAVERRRLMMVTSVLALLTVGLLALLTALDLVEIWHLYGAGFILTIVGVLDRPARQALIPALVARDHLLNAYTMMTTLVQVGGLVGPVIAGLALILGGPALGYAAHALSYVAVLLALALLKVPPVVTSGRGVSVASVVEGLKFVGSRPLILGLLGLDMAAMLFGYYQILLPIIARDVLHVGEVGFGMLSAAPAAGALVGASAMLILGSLRRPGVVMLLAVAAYGCALVGLGLSTLFPLSLLFAGLLGVTDALSVTIRHTTVQLSTPDELRGRVSSAFQISVQGGNSLGAVTVSFAASVLGAGAALVLGGGLVVLVVGLFGALIRPIREYRVKPAD